MPPLADRLRDLLRFDEARATPPDRLLFLVGLALVLLLFARPLFFSLGNFDLENDEAIYSHAVLSITEEGAWLSPWSSPGTGPFLEKPPLKLWLVALGMLAGLPEDELGLRFFDPLLGTFAFLYLYALAYRAGGWLAGVGAVGTLFLFEPLLFEHGLRANTMDAALVLAYCGGAWHCLASMRAAAGSRASRGHLLAATLFFTFGFLVKFVAALFLPMVAGAALLLHRQARPRLRQDFWPLVAAAAVFLALAAPWFLYQHLREGVFFWRVILGQHVVERFTHHLDPHHLHPFSYYFVLIGRDLAEAGTLVAVLLGLGLWLYASRRDRSFFGLWVGLWAFLPLFAISFGTSKLIHYTYPFLPPLGLFAGFALARLAAAGWEILRPLGGWLTRLPRPRAAALLALASFFVFGSILLTGRFHARFDKLVVRSRSAPRALAAGLGSLALVPEAGLALPAAALLALHDRPARRYQQILANLDQGPHALQDLASCLGRGGARTLVDDGKSRPLVFVHAFLSDGIYHPVAFYSRRGRI